MFLSEVDEEEEMSLFLEVDPFQMFLLDIKMHRVKNMSDITFFTTIGTNKSAV